MTVDEILASGKYTDRRGRRWFKRRDGNWQRNVDERTSVLAHEWYVSLLIERDMHRDECVGLRACLGHPVPHVVYLRKHHVWSVNAGDPFNAQPDRDTLAEAMDAARRLAVGNG